MDAFLNFFREFDFMQIASAFIVLFAIIDILGSIPIILNLKRQGEDVKPLQTSSVSLAIMLLFLFAGDWILQLFNVDIRSFAVAGALIIFFMALEMVLAFVYLRMVEIRKSRFSTNNFTEMASKMMPKNLRMM